MNGATPPTLGGHEILDEIGRGGMGRVLRARDAATGAIRALKVLEGQVRPDAVERFRREAQALARVGRGVVPIHASGAEGGRLWFVMDLAPGGSLADRGRLEWREAARIVAALARTLERCSALGLVHRDVKPANILLDERGDPLLADFGCVLDTERARLTATGAAIGTPAYMSPEQLDGRPVGPATDVFALGVVLHELVTGERPRPGRNVVEVVMARAKQRRARPSELVACPEQLDAIVERALVDAPEARPTAGELASLLEALRDPAARPAQEAPPRRRARAVGALLVVAVALAVAGALARRAPRPSGATSHSEQRARAALADPRASSAALLAAMDALAADAADLATLFGDAAAPGVADLLLGRAEELPEPLRGELLARAHTLAARRLGARPGDPEALALRALAGLAAASLPTVALGPGTVAAPIASSAIADLVAAGGAPGPIRARAAWLAVDLLATSGADSESRAQLDRARSAAPDPELARCFEVLLGAPRSAEGLSRLRGAEPSTPLRGAAVLQRFFARCGAPGAIDDAALAAVASDAAIACVALRGAPLRFATEAPNPPSLESALQALREATSALRPDVSIPDAEKLRERLDANRDRILSRAHEALQRVPHPRVLELCVEAPQLGLATVPLAVLATRNLPRCTEWLAGAITPKYRGLSRTGVGWDLYPDGLDAPPPAFDVALEEAVRRDEVVAARLGRDLPDALAAAKALERLEALASEEGLAPGARDEAVFVGALGLEAFVRVAGPGALPFRARFRALAFPGPLGVSLARVDAARAASAIRALRLDGPSGVDAQASRYALVAASAAPEGDATARELYDLGVHWMHEEAIEHTVRAGPDFDFKQRLFALRVRGLHERIAPLLREVDFEETSDDRRRASQETYTFRPFAKRSRG